MTPEISRADLLRVLARAPGLPAAALARLLGWEGKEHAEPDAAQSTATAAPSVAGAAVAPVRYLARPAPVYWHLVGCEPLPGEPAPDRPEDPARVATDSAQEPGPPPDPRIAPLLAPGQWQNLWDRLPPSPRRGRAVDLPACLRRLTRAEPLRDLPRRPRGGFNRAVTLILDRPAALRPVWDDLRLARRSLAALLGDDLQTFLLPAGPDGPWLEAPGAADPLQPEAIDPGPDAIPAAAPVVLIGAFGALDSAEIAPDWQRLLARLGAAGHPLLLVPVCPLRQTALPAAPLDPAIDSADSDSADRALGTLLAALSQTWLPTPARLRALRRAIPGASLHTELRVYNAPDIARDAFHLWLAPDQLPFRLDRFAALPQTDSAPLRRAIDTWRRGLDTGAQAIERLQASLLDPGPPGLYPGLAEQAAAVAAGLNGPSTMERAQLAAMLPVLARLDAARGPSWRPVLRDADRLARAIGLGAIADADSAGRDAPTHTLVQRGADLLVRPGDGGILAIGPSAYSPETGLLVDGAPLAGQGGLTVIDRGHRWRLATLTRPRWAERCWSDGRDLFAAHADNAILRWLPAAPDRREGAWQPEHNPWTWAAEIGADGFGLWARLDVRGVPYRLRWISPGRFLMGSPEDEPERSDDETEHEVMLTRGFWLGETAVPQAVWRAVMGENPSRFKGDELPVEQVNWDDCRRFVAKLAGMAPGLGPQLPTEAQWEYACRAGTRTAFSFGNALDTGLANYDGEYRYDKGAEGKYRQRTLPVRSFESNDWGLCQMHGNVYECCQDWYGAYPAGPVSDPMGPTEGSYRVLRGSSWDGYGRDLRSACRGRGSPGARYAFFGLRLAGGLDPQASRPGQAGAGAMTADGREQNDRPVGGQGVGAATMPPSRYSGSPPK